MGIPAGKIHNVSPKNHALLRETARGDGDVTLDLRGARHLPPHERAIINKGGPVRAKVPLDSLKERQGQVQELPAWWWNPSNPMAAALPGSVSPSRYAEVQRALKGYDPRLSMTWNGKRNVWQMWYHAPHLDLPEHTGGWVMIKEFKAFHNTAYLLKVIAHMDRAKKGSLKKEYNQKMLPARQQAKQAAAARRSQHNRDVAGMVYDHARPSVGYGRSRGDKFARYG